MSSLHTRRQQFLDDLEIDRLTRARDRADRILFRLDDTRDVAATCRAFKISRADLYAIAEDAGEHELALLAA